MTKKWLILGQYWLLDPSRCACPRGQGSD